jgi:hypothetical protein
MRLPPLNAETAPGYLRERGLLDAVPDSQVRTVDFSRRNHNIGVEIEGAGAWFIKQIQYHTPEVVASLEREAACYRAAQHAELASMGGSMARLVDFDEANSILIMEFLNCLNGVECHMRVGPFDVRIPVMLGQMVGTLHQTDPAALQARLPGILRKELPWVLQPIASHDSTGSRARFLSAFLTDPTIVHAVEAVREDWRADTVIHGDCRLENFVFCRPKHDDAPLDTKLVDWELADIGDAVWDCASVMQHYWSQWTSSGSPSPERWDALVSALTAFWEAYTGTRGIAGSAGRNLFLRVTLFTGMRMVQKAYEHFATEGWIPEASRSLQLARLLLTDPGQALQGFAVYGHDA